VADMNTKTKKSAQDKKSQEEPKKGTYTSKMVTVTYVINMHDLGYHNCKFPSS